MSANPIRSSEKETYTQLFQTMGQNITLLSRHCQTLGNLLARMDSHHDFEAIGKQYEGESLENIPPMQAAQYMSVLLGDRIGAILCPLPVALEMYSDCLHDGIRPNTELSDTILESMKQETIAQHFRNAPSHVAFIPSSKQRSYTWTDMLDTIRTEIVKTALSCEEKETLTDVITEIQTVFSDILQKREMLQYIATRLNPPQEVRGR